VSLYSHSTDLSVRPVHGDDLAQLRRLIETSRRAHLSLDWRALDDWVGNPAFLVVRSSGRIVGFGMGVRDASPVAWLRALVVEDGLGAGALLGTILPPMLDALRVQGAPALVCLAWAEWLSDTLSGHGFAPMARVLTLRKNDAIVPDCPLAEGVWVREAQPADLDAMAVVDHAAFEAEWWYGHNTFLRMLHHPARFVVAELNGELVGYAFGDTLGWQAHVTRLAVHPAVQRRGVGAQLLVDLVTHFGGQGVEAFTVNTQTYNEASLRLYCRFGFAPVGDPVTVWHTRL
jgi:ribosomal-protein-alanine N-acetyltransferase